MDRNKQTPPKISFCFWGFNDGALCYTCRTVCLSVYWTHVDELCKTAEPIDMQLGGETRGPTYGLRKIVTSCHGWICTTSGDWRRLAICMLIANIVVCTVIMLNVLEEPKMSQHHQRHRCQPCVLRSLLNQLIWSCSRVHQMTTV